MKLTNLQRECITDAGIYPLKIIERNDLAPTKARAHNGQMYGAQTLRALIDRHWLAVDNGYIKANDDGLYQLPRQDALSVMALKCLMASLNRRAVRG